MASAIETGKSGKSASLDADINLVPFIDLLSMCICFLLMTAVWTELGTIEIRQMFGMGAQTADSHPTIDFKLSLMPENQIDLVIAKNLQPTQSLHFKGESAADARSKMEQQLDNLVRALQNDPSAPILNGQVVATVSSQYGDLVAFLDLFRSHGLTGLAILPEARK